MALSFVWTDRSKTQLDATLRHLSTEWGPREAANFLDILDDWLGQLRSHPKSAPLTGEKPGVRGAVLTKQVTMFYHVETSEQQITILSFFDTRQHPDKKRL